MLLAPILQVRFQIFRAAKAFKDGRLEIRFEDGSQIDAPADPRLESWTITGTGAGDRLLMVSLPGSDLAIWLKENDQ